MKGDIEVIFLNIIYKNLVNNLIKFLIWARHSNKNFKVKNNPKKFIKILKYA